MRARKNAAGLWTCRPMTPPNKAGKRIRLYVQCPRTNNTRAHLDKLVRDAIDRHLEGVATSRLTFAAFFESIFLPEYPAAENLATSTVDQYEYLIGDVACKHIGAKPIGDIDTGTIARLVKRLRDESEIDAAVNKEEGRRARALQNQSQPPSVAKDFHGLEAGDRSETERDQDARVSKEEGRRARARALQNFGQGLSTATINAALKVADHLLNWAAATGLDPSTRLQAAAEMFVDSKRDELKPSTAGVYRYHLRRHLAPYLGDTPIGQITDRELGAVRAQLATDGKYRAIYVAGAFKKNGTLKKPWEIRRDQRRGGAAGQKQARFSPQTLRNLVVNLKSVLGYAKVRGHITTVPEIAIPKVPKARTAPPYTREEAQHLIKAAPPKRRVLYVLSYDAGCRKSELLGLHWEQVLWDRHLIKFDRQRYRGRLKACKFGKEREVPMSKPLETALKKLYLEAEDKNGPVFTRDDGGTLEEHHLRVWHERDTEKAGLRKVRWHSKRHTFGSCFKGTPWELQALLGHEDIRTTMTYVHPAAENMPSILDDEATK